MKRDHAAASYADLASFYDRFTAAHDHEDWARTLEGVALAHGLRGKRLLEIACGTGNLLVPFLGRGYAAVGCDLTPEMLALARPKVGGEVKLAVADVRALPPLGRFDLTLCIGDVLNYLLEPADLAAALSSIRRVLKPAGLALFDANTLGAYRSVFASHRCVEDEHGLVIWRGLGDPEASAGARVETIVDAFTVRNGHFERTTSRHLHRHHLHAEVASAIAAAGLCCLAVHGVTPDGALHDDVDELVHTKRLYVVTPASSATRKGEEHASDQEARVAGGSRRRLYEGELEAVPSLGVSMPGEGSPLAGGGGIP